MAIKSSNEEEEFRGEGMCEHDFIDGTIRRTEEKGTNFVNFCEQRAKNKEQK